MEMTIDRIEGEFAVLELADGKTVSVPLALLPQGAKEGDVLEIRVSGRKTEERKQEIHALAEELWED